MRNIILYSAMSLDGFIARKNGGIDWLAPLEGEDYGYEAFYASIDTTLTGYKTYQQMLGFGEFPYPGKTNYVFSRQHREPDGNPVTFVSSDIPSFINDLKSETGNDIWLVGGGEINAILLRAGLIDEMRLFVHPIILGEGIPLFNGGTPEMHFKLAGTKEYSNGLVEMDYERIT